MEVKIDIDTYNHNASRWLSSLILGNYNIAVNLDHYKLYVENWDDRILINPQSPDDYFRSIIYLINSSTEYDQTIRDKFGRLPFSVSFQNKNNIIEENLVHRYLKTLLQYENIALPDLPAQMVVSHDIDTLHNGIIYELYRGLKTMDFGLMSRVLIAAVTGKPVWYNIEQILELLEKNDVTSVFYFITEKGHSIDKIKNADYCITEPRVQNLIKRIESKGHEIGLHKSSLDTDYKSECIKLPETSKSNRNHYLRYRIPQLYRALSDAPIWTDTSLCFPYQMGFRNNYGLPFQPFDLETGKTLDVLEIPFQMMDGMFATDNLKDAQRSLENILRFIENNRQNCVLGMLWHNTELSQVAHPHSYGNFSEILKYLRANKIECVTPRAIREKYFSNLNVK